MLSLAGPYANMLYQARLRPCSDLPHLSLCELEKNKSALTEFVMPGQVDILISISFLYIFFHHTNSKGNFEYMFYVKSKALIFLKKYILTFRTYFVYNFLIKRPKINNLLSSIWCIVISNFFFSLVWGHVEVPRILMFFYYN
jgi:hypothetical protein